MIMLIIHMFCLFLSMIICYYKTNLSLQVKEQNPAIQETWSSIVNRVKDTFKDANDLIPGAKEQAEALQSKFTDLSNLVKQEYDKISKNVAEQTGTIQENFAKNVKPTIDNLVQQIQTTGTKIQEAVVKANDPPAS